MVSSTQDVSKGNAATPIAAPAAEVCGFRLFGFASEADLLQSVKAPCILVALNAEKLARADPRLQDITNQNVGYADGMGAVLAARRKGVRSARIAGADLWLTAVRTFAGLRTFYLIGSTDAVINATVARLGREQPTLEVVGHRNGYMDDAAIEQLANSLIARRPDVVLVAMGSPRQELVMARLVRVWPALYMGLGGSFEIYAGRKRRAPRAMQRLGLEWLHRFVTNPTRLPRLPMYVSFAVRLLQGRL